MKSYNCSITPPKIELRRYIVIKTNFETVTFFKFVENIYHKLKFEMLDGKGHFQYNKVIQIPVSWRKISLIL